MVLYLQGESLHVQYSTVEHLIFQEMQGTDYHRHEGGVASFLHFRRRYIVDLGIVL